MTHSYQFQVFGATFTEIEEAAILECARYFNTPGNIHFDVESSALQVVSGRIVYVKANVYARWEPNT